MTIKEDDLFWMRRAIKLAKKGKGHTAPNPAVGAVIVKKGLVIGEGYHEKAGSAHAEVAAIIASYQSVKGATLYVTLEPCNHHGRTGPCAETIIDAGIKSVIFGSRDRSPKKGAKGLARLRRAKIKVTAGVLKKECDALVADFHKLAKTGLPYVTVKTAMTLDGKIATQSGDSKWITSETSRRLVHKMRGKADIVMVGIETVLVDDPALTARHSAARRQPLRLVMDSHLRIPYKAKLIETHDTAPLLIMTTADAPKAKIDKLLSMGIGVAVVASEKGKIDLKSALAELGRRGFMNIFLEGGGALSGAMFDHGYVDKVRFFISPKIAGGSRSAMSGNGVARMADAWKINRPTVTMIGGDILVEGEVSRD